MTRIDAEVLITGTGRLLRDASVVVDDDGRIVSMPAVSLRNHESRTRHVQILLPGVINAHTHLTDAEIDAPVESDGTLVGWVQRLFEARAARPDNDTSADRASNGPGQSVSLAAVVDVLERMKQAGTVAIGEVSNGMATLAPIRASGITTRFILELIGFRRDVADAALMRANGAIESVEWNEEIHPTLAIHAPYSVSPDLAVAIRDHNRRRGTITYVHMTEDPAERELYQGGGGPWRELMQRIGAWDDDWSPPGRSPLAQYDQLGLLNRSIALVHLADATPSEVALVAERGAHVILSPTSNHHIGGRLPPMRDIVAHEIPFALGTDGRGSNPSIDVFDEARLLLDHFDWIDPMLLLSALTANGARTLGFPSLGVIEVGKRPGFIEVTIDRTDGPDRDVAASIIRSDDRRPLIAALDSEAS